MKGTTIISGFSHLPFLKLWRRHLYLKLVKIKMSVAKGFYSHRISSECPSSFHTKYQINPKRLKILGLSHIQKNHRMQSLLEDVVISFIFAKNRIINFLNQIGILISASINFRAHRGMNGLIEIGLWTIFVPNQKESISAALNKFKTIQIRRSL